MGFHNETLDPAAGVAFWNSLSKALIDYSKREHPKPMIKREVAEKLERIVTQRIDKGYILGKEADYINKGIDRVLDFFYRTK